MTHEQVKETTESEAGIFHTHMREHKESITEETKHAVMSVSEKRVEIEKEEHVKYIPENKPTKESKTPVLKARYKLA